MQPRSVIVEQIQYILEHREPVRDRDEGHNKGHVVSYENGARNQGVNTLEHEYGDLEQAPEFGLAAPLEGQRHAHVFGDQGPYEEDYIRR